MVENTSPPRTFSTAGEEEMNNNQVKIKNLKTQEQYYVAIEDILGGKL